MKIVAFPEIRLRILIFVYDFSAIQAINAYAFVV